MKFVWIPEAPAYPGLYANISGRDMDPPGKIRDAVLQPSTMDVHAARQFATEAECLAWCHANPSPAFEPREHGIGDPGPTPNPVYMGQISGG